MSFIYLLAGEDLELAEAELRGFLQSQDINEVPERRGRLAETEAEPSMLKRLAMTHEVSRKIAEIQTPSQFKQVDYRPKGKFAVRTRGIERNEEGLEEALGTIMSTEENEVSLDHPETIVKAYLLENKIIIGEMVQDIDRGLFQKRKNQERPFSSPISLDPVLARTLVNLSGLSRGETILDPFCGTGGILIEAGLCAISVQGTDSSKEMVKGTRKNLEEYGVINHDIKKKDISETTDNFEEADAIVTDLPYGKASLEQGDPVEEFLKKLKLGTPAVFMYNEDSLGDYEPDFELYVHNNLTRYVYRVNL